MKPLVMSVLRLSILILIILNFLGTQRLDIALCIRYIPSTDCGILLCLNITSDTSIVCQLLKTQVKVHICY